ncbi:hypothetical protein DPEC_G00245150 [Dallia pectoralis]|uniref:Uncharacterized protein n=1 Tax=Dallia pectoralis TaxID=75939 RepID=A0ACC2FVQ7_DALPE|nr:hypothetical protein DPEC_G00245150 [Dallia pectoralis]
MTATFFLHQGPFGSLQGAFRPKISNDSAPGSHKQPQMDSRRLGRWDSMHVCIAWQIYHHKLRVKKTQVNTQAFDFSIKTDCQDKPAGSDLIQVIHNQRDLIQSSTSLFYPESYSRNYSFGCVGPTSITTYGRPSKPALNNPVICQEIVNPLGVRETPKLWRSQQMTPQSTRHLPREKMEMEQYSVQHQGHNAAETRTLSPNRDKPAPQTTTEKPAQRSEGIRSWESCEIRHDLETENYMKAKKIKKGEREGDQAVLNKCPVPQEPTKKPMVSACITAPIPYPEAEGYPKPMLSQDPRRDPLWNAYLAKDRPFSSHRELVTRATPLYGSVRASLVEGADSPYRQPHHCFPSCYPSMASKQQENSYLMEREHRRILREDYYHHRLRLATLDGHLLHHRLLTSKYPRSNVPKVGFSQSHQNSLLNQTPLPGSLLTLPPLVCFSLPV